MRLKALTANLGHGGPREFVAREERREWLGRVAAEDCHLLFLQEMPRDREWVEDVAAFGWRLVTTDGRRYNCRSGVAVLEDWDATGRPVPNGDYHGSYVAGAEVTVPGRGGVLCVSVHASPTPLKSTDHEQWGGQLGRLRRPSPGMPAVWHSDQVLHDVAGMIDGPAILAGDLNEARRWDDRFGGYFGADWFANAERAGLHDLLFPVWQRERSTRDGYQVDHLLGTTDFLGRVGHADFGPDSWSDHRCIAVTLDLA